MATSKPKKKVAAKVTSLAPRKQVKGGRRRTEDPCQGGEITKRK